MIQKTTFLFLVICFSTNGYGQQSNEAEHLSAWLDSLRTVYDVPSVSIAVILDGEIVWTEGIGVKSTRTKDRVNQNSLYQAASISKTVTAMGTIRLMQSGKIGLYDNANDHLSSWKIPSASKDSVITPFHLLSHTSGLYAAHFYGYKAHKAFPNLLQVLNGQKPAKSNAINREQVVGFEYKYSGSGYCILQQLLLDKTDQSFDSLLTELVFSKFGMQRSSFSIPNDINNIAQAHYKGKPLKNGYLVYPELAAAGLWTTPTDLASLLIGLGKCKNLDSKLIKPDYLKVVLKPTKTNDGEINNYGLGLMLDQQTNGLHIGHTGSTAGYRCFMKYNIDENYGIVIMTNSANGIPLIDNLVEHLANHYNWNNFKASF
jgi:CubicO group peptidase (beta-lactamase class C family)